MTTKECIGMLVAYFRVDPDDYGAAIDALRDCIEHEIPAAHRQALYKKITRSCKFFPRVEEVLSLYEDVRPPEHHTPILFNLEEIKKLKALREKFIALARAHKPCPYNEWLYYAQREWMLDKYEELHPEEVQDIPPEAWHKFESAMEVKHL